ncbi:tetratricopeptide repeat-containing sensor histidine kinase [Flavisericum labens]|uniref:tetratricopeptide repeat-containing sensor histidine kinase n=1 Tax=Flavisericum labens TaxID=3377112 RepID=UPI00387B1F8E
MKFIFILLLFAYHSVCYSQKDTTKSLDSIQYFLIQSNPASSIDLDKKIVFAQRAKNLAVISQIDSLIIKSDINLAIAHSANKDYKSFLSHIHEALKKAKKTSDSFSIAHIYKNLGYYYYEKNNDSAYYYDDKAEKLFNRLNDKLNRAIVLYDIALLQKDEKDLTGSELTSVNALSILNQLNETNNVIKYQSYFYGNLAHVFKMLEQFDESIKYHKKAIEKISVLPNNGVLLDTYKNNLALAYKDAGQYKLAINYYNEILGNKNLIEQRPLSYAITLDNYAHALFLSNNYEELPNLFFKALKICDSLNNDANTIIINQHLAHYYLSVNNKDSAKYYAYKSKQISEKYSPDDLLRSYALLSKIEEDSVAVKYYDAYVKLNDSLIKNERATRNKFARIRFETSEIEQENIQIAKERMWLLIISVVVILASFLLYLVITQRNKNKELQFIQKQQETNEEIYNLMLSQNETIEEARALEKKRISEELHDGVLGRLFGTRLSLDSLNMNNSTEAVKTRGQYIAELKTIEEDIRKVSHELNTDFVSGSGFIDIIKTLVETQTLAYELNYKLERDDDINWDAVSNKKKIHIYRILQETLHNIYKHAYASHVNISFKLKNDVICLSIADDGAGFDVNKAKSGIGLKNINSRVDEIDGTINITSEKDKGTTVILEAPIG